MSEEPKVTAITPREVAPGEVIQVVGEGFRKRDRVEIWDATHNQEEKRISKKATKRVSAQELELRLPKRLSGGRKRLVIIRDEGAYPVTASFTVIPVINELVAAEGTELTIRGHGFTPDSRVRIGNVDLVPTKVSLSRLTVTLPRGMSLEDAMALAVAVPAPPPAPRGLAGPAMDAAPVPLVTTGFDVLRDGFSFVNGVDYQAASWGTFQETFGKANIKRANRLPTFLFLWAYYALYTSFFEGVGIFQASGLCSGLAALCLERFCAGESPNIDIELTMDVRKQLTARMGKILGKEVLVAAYEQCKQGLASVPVTLNKMQESLDGGITAGSAQLLWFLPSGRITERKFLEQLSYAHSVVPYGVLFGRDADGARWRIPIYDVNMPRRNDVWVQIEQRDGEWSWFHNQDARYSSEKGMTLAAIPLQLFLKPAEFPFTGPFGLTRFLFDMLL